MDNRANESSGECDASTHTSSSSELETAISAILVDGIDVDAGMPVIELRDVPSVVNNNSSTRRTIDDIEATSAVVEPPGGEDGIISLQDLESSPIAHQVVGENDTMNPEDRSLRLIERRAEFLSATVNKANKDDPIGLGLTVKNGEVLISSLDPATLAENTPFRVGDRMLSVNGRRCYIMDSDSVVQYMASLVGRVTIVVHNGGGDPNLVESMVTRPPSTRCGLVLESRRGLELKISKIDHGGIFFDSLLTVGDPVLCINGEDCTYSDAQDAAAKINRAGQYITIKARTQLETGVVVAAFSCNNSTGSGGPPQIMKNFLIRLGSYQPTKVHLAALVFATVSLVAFVWIAGW